MSFLSGIGDLFNQPEAAKGPYDKYEISSKYVWDSGLLDLPVAYFTGSQQNVAQPGYSQPLNHRLPASQIPVSAPLGYRVVTFDVARWGAPVTMPSPLPANANEVLLYAEVEPYGPILQPDGRTFYQQARGRYVFALVQPLFPTTDNLLGTATAASTDTFQTNVTTPAQFNTDLS